MYKAYFELSTVFLYIFIGLLGYFCVKHFMMPISYRNRISGRQFNNTKIWELLFLFIFVFLATFRFVAHNIGGGDALTYVTNFQDVLRGGEDRTGNTEFEPGFMFVTKLIRSLTSEYRIYFAICYGFIAWSYIKFLRTSCPRGLCYIPFVLLMYPYLKSFCTMRSSIAIGLFLIGIALLRKHKWWSLVFIVSTLFFHRMSIMFVPIWPFYYIFERKFKDLPCYKFVFFSLGGVFFTFFAALQVQQYVIALDILSQTDSWYLTHNSDQNLLMRFPMFFGQLLLFVAIIVLYKRVDWNETTKTLRTLFIYDIWMIPSALILGMWRNIEYLYLVRLSLWSVLLYTYTRKKKSAQIIKMAALVAFVSWLFFRVYKEWDDAKLSPYIFDLF